nr:unnamed protein product [Digitaria exilis]
MGSRLHEASFFRVKYAVLRCDPPVKRRPQLRMSPHLAIPSGVKASALAVPAGLAEVGREILAAECHPLKQPDLGCVRDIEHLALAWLDAIC